MKCKFFNVLLLLSILGMQSALGEFYEHKSDARFYKIIEEQHRFAIVLFEPFDVDEKNEDALEEMEKGFERLSKRNRYKDVDMAFIAADLDQIPELIDDLLLSEEEPTLMLFKNGKAVKKDDENLKEVGFLNRVELEDFIEEHFGDDITERLERKQEVERIKEEARRQKEQAQMQQPTQKVIYQQKPPVQQVEYETYPSYTSSYPYYDYGYGYPYFGFGFGRRGFRGGFGRRGFRRGFGRRGFRRGFGRRGFRGGFRGGRRGGMRGGMRRGGMRGGMRGGGMRGGRGGRGRR